MATVKLRVGDVLKALVKHPDVIRRRGDYFQAVAAAKRDRVKIAVGDTGWTMYKPNKYADDKHITMGIWTSFHERMELLEDMFLYKNQDDLIRSIQSYGQN